MPDTVYESNTHYSGGVAPEAEVRQSSYEYGVTWTGINAIGPDVLVLNVLCRLKKTIKQYSESINSFIRNVKKSEEVSKNYLLQSGVRI